MVKKKLNEAKLAEQQKESNREYLMVSSKKSSKKILKNKKKVEDINKNAKKGVKM